MSVADYTSEEKEGFTVLPADSSPTGNGQTGTGPLESGIFPAESIRYAMRNDGSEGHGIEMALSLADLGVGQGSFRAFAFIVSGTAYFSNVLLPGDAVGDVDPFDNFGFNVDFGDVDGGPFHTEWFELSEVVSIQDPSGELPSQMILSQNYPNPFNPTTNIRYAIPESGQVTLEVYNVLGQRVAVLIDEVMQPGSYTVSFDANRLASGVYMYRISANGQVLTRKMTLVK